jgi:hypothetical protein
MVEAMGDQLAAIVSNDFPSRKPLYSTDAKLQSDVTYEQNEWLLLFKGQNATNIDTYNVTALEIVGKRVNYRLERKYDRKFFSAVAVSVLQRAARIFLVRNRRWHKRRSVSMIFVQKYARRFLARVRAQFLRDCIQARMVIRLWESFQAQQVVTLMKKERLASLL